METINNLRVNIVALWLQNCLHITISNVRHGKGKRFWTHFVGKFPWPWIETADQLRGNFCAIFSKIYESFYFSANNIFEGSISLIKQNK